MKLEIVSLKSSNDRISTLWVNAGKDVPITLSTILKATFFLLKMYTVAQNLKNFVKFLFLYSLNHPTSNRIFIEIDLLLAV